MADLVLSGSKKVTVLWNQSPLVIDKIYNLIRAIRQNYRNINKDKID